MIMSNQVSIDELRLNNRVLVSDNSFNLPGLFKQLQIEGKSYRFITKSLLNIEWDESHWSWVIKSKPVIFEQDVYIIRLNDKEWKDQWEFFFSKLYGKDVLLLLSDENNE